MKVLQVMCGAERGGAEEFFVRLATAFAKTPISQKVVIRAYPDRVDELKAKGVDMELLPFRRRLDFRTSRLVFLDFLAFQGRLLS